MERLTTLNTPTSTFETVNNQSALYQEHVSWHIPEDFSGIMPYNPRHDIQAFLDLKNLNGKIPQDKFAQRQAQIIAMTKTNLEKALGERFRVEKSTTYYYLIDGKLTNPDFINPVVEEYKKGQLFLKREGSTETEREEAEVQGIEQVERLLANSRDITLVIASPRSVGCRHGEEEDPQNEPEDILYHSNFFDVYQKKNDQITMTRLHSTNDCQSFLQAAKSLDPSFREPTEAQELTAAYLLRTPAITHESLDKIIEVYSLNEKTQDYQDNLKVVEACTPFILSYINTLVNNPLDIEKVKLTLNTIYNVSDKTTDKIKQLKKQVHTANYQLAYQKYRQAANQLPQATILVDQQIDYYGRQPVRSVSGGPCPGIQKGFSVSGKSPLASFGRSIGVKSVSDFARFYDDEDEEVTDFQCPGYLKNGTKCTFTIKAYSGVKKCPECKLEATCTR